VQKCTPLLLFAPHVSLYCLDWSAGAVDAAVNVAIPLHWLHCTGSLLWTLYRACAVRSPMYRPYTVIFIHCDRCAVGPYHLGTVAFGCGCLAGAPCMATCCRAFVQLAPSSWCQRGWSWLPQGAAKAWSSAVPDWPLAGTPAANKWVAIGTGLALCAVAGMAARAWRRQ
jgi:hypothetical protein